MAALVTRLRTVRPTDDVGRGLEGKNIVWTVVLSFSRVGREFGCKPLGKLVHCYLLLPLVLDHLPWYLDNSLSVRGSLSLRKCLPLSLRGWKHIMTRGKPKDTGVPVCIARRAACELCKSPARDRLTCMGVQANPGGG